ncbi:MAG: hypothetical protein JNN08_04780 [Bryobacterales bacterium]|nr:hypothetical protein [Bryobacterales bacterium]
MMAQPGDFAAFASLRASQRRERERISHVLHDEIGQVLTAAGLELDLLQLDYAAQPELAEGIAAVQKTLEGAFARVRCLSHEVHPEPVSRFGFLPVVERLVEAARRGFGGEIVLHLDGKDEPSAALGGALVECAREALDNAARHSGAARIDITVYNRGNVRQLTVADNGCGFALEKAVPGLGFFTFGYYQSLGMLYLKLESERGRGTCVTLNSRNRDE